MTHACWDFILKKGPYPEGCAVAQEHLAKMRHEFEYWYPMDMRVSAKDLIRNHLTMCLYNHAGIWEDEKLLPRSIFCNGYVLLDKRKMSKSEGNFLTLRDAIDLFGVDATRLTLADAGDGLDDANFDREMANQAILKLFTLEEWIKKNVAAACPDGKCDYAAGKASLDLWDRIFEHSINQAIVKTTKFFDEMKFKQALNHAFFNLQIVKEDYLIAKEGKPNPYIVLRFCETQLILMNAIIPHFAQYCWRTYLCPVLKASSGYDTPLSENLMKMPWPVASGPTDKTASSMLKYMKDLKSEIRQGWANAQSGGKKKKGKGKTEDAAEAPKIEVCNIFCA